MKIKYSRNSKVSKSLLKRKLMIVDVPFTKTELDVYQMFLKINCVLKALSLFMIHESISPYTVWSYFSCLT